MALQLGTGATDAVELAKQMGELGFAEFTTDLVTQVFAGLLDAHVKQMEAYQELLATVAVSLTEFIQQTNADVTPEEVVAFLEALGIASGGPANAAERSALNQRLALPAGAGIDGGTNTIDSNTTTVDIHEAVARRIAGDRFEFLQRMVAQGVLRLVVDHGRILTRLRFKTYGRSSRGTNRSSSNSTAFGFGGGGGFGFGVPGVVAGVGAGAGVGQVSVRADSSFDRDTTGSSVSVLGEVEIHFKTDYLPLSPPAPPGP